MTPCPICDGTKRILRIPAGWKLDGTLEASRCDYCGGTGGRTSRHCPEHLARSQATARRWIAEGRLRVA